MTPKHGEAWGHRGGDIVMFVGLDDGYAKCMILRVGDVLTEAGYRTTVPAPIICRIAAPALEEQWERLDDPE
jgi:hypothetical protein